MQSLAPILDTLEKHYGAVTPGWPTDPYRFLLWWQCGYPPSDERCTRGWDALNAAVGVTPRELIAARSAKLARALEAGGMVPELRATRLKTIARSVQSAFAGDLAAALARLSLPEARKALKRFPGIGPPGADHILLFGGVAAVPAVPSNCPHVLVRLASGPEPAQYTETYRKAVALTEAHVPATLGERRRAYLVLKRHGGELCKAKKPKCGECPVAPDCAFAARRGRPRARID